MLVHRHSSMAEGVRPGEDASKALGAPAVTGQWSVISPLRGRLCHPDKCSHPEAAFDLEFDVRKLPRTAIKG